MSERTTDGKRHEIRIPELGDPISHYTDAVRFGDLLFISGVVGVDETGRVVSSDPAEQTRQIFRRMDTILKAAGASFRDILKVTVYLTNIDDRPKINPVRQEFFGDTRPASTLVEVSRLARPGVRVEIEAIAGIPHP